MLSAKAKVVSLLARREHSRKELTLKLAQKGYPDDDIREAIDWAVAHQFQSDDRFGRSLMRRRASNLGDRAIEAELSWHALQSENPQAAPHDDEAPKPEGDRAFEWLERRYQGAVAAILGGEQTDKQQALHALKAKAMRALSARGFEFHNIQKAWKRLLFEFESDA